MTAADLKRALVRTFVDVVQNHTMMMAAALSYYFVLSLFPAVVFLSAGLAYLPIPDLFSQPSSIFVHLLPREAVAVIAKAIAEIVGPHRGTLLSFGIVGTLWAASSGFSAAIEALDVAYDVEDNRPFWVTRSLSLALTFVAGLFFLIAFGVMIVGPRFGEWLAGRIHLSRVFVLLWPTIHWTIAIAFAVLGVEALYFFAPNIKQRYLATLPGAVLAVACWIGLSYLLGAYLRHFADFDRTYGTLGAAIALMVWLYWTGFAMLVGAELNAELAKRSRLGRLLPKQSTSSETKLDSAA